MRSESISFRRALVLLGLGVALLALAALSSESVGAANDPKASEAPPDDGVRTLDAIQIEGEIAIPQVLFITSRDHPRYRDGLRERYRESALELGRGAQFPYRLVVLTEHPQPQK